MRLMESVKATVLVRPKEGILDPQGQAVEELAAQARLPVDEARVGRLVDLELDDRRPGGGAQRRSSGCASELLANPLIESYEIELAAEREHAADIDPTGADEEHGAQQVVVVHRSPGSNDDGDAASRSTASAPSPARLAHRGAPARRTAAVVLPGGFSYGDYLRCGAIARSRR